MGTKLLTAQKVATRRITMIEMDIKLATAKQAETQSIIMTKTDTKLAHRRQSKSYMHKNSTDSYEPVLFILSTK